MFRLSEILDRLSNLRLPENKKKAVKQLFRASESPLGFGLIAGAGMMLLVVANVLGGETEAPAEPETNIQAENESPADSATGDAQALAQAESEPTPVAPLEKEYSLQRNETLIGLFMRADMPSATAHQIVAALREVTNLRRLQRGQDVRITTAADGTVESLRMRDSFDEEAVVTLTDAGYKASRESIPTISLTRLVEGEITDSLYLSAQREGMPTAVIVELIRLMSFDVDFEREIRTGDKFQVYFERKYSPDFGDMQEGRLLQARLQMQGGELEANYYVDSNGEGDYYDADGKSTRKALMKTPLDVTVVTSNYGKRKHPVLGYTRMHKGVDFRARTGTPIMAAGDGVVERASRYGSYGNYIRIRHNGTYTTAYAHLSKYGKGIKAGARVRQGQVIGYAGATGRVSAAHLHYEVMMNGKQVNPLKLDLPTGRELKGQDLETYASARAALMADILQIKTQNDVMLAAERGEKPVDTLDDTVSELRGTDR
ncbi:M23 family metallopeptidase [Kordiimonas gwangyangensis]|uniref:M23 family metallopeptidase n=2 Tax=Kordiimonas gwangyangensis TaxID=288022 RepID=UPI00037EEA7C|nr:peptidoglycan DD-metalloendopeptidase family protein [Kordiimonas gwangyangensis]